MGRLDVKRARDAVENFKERVKRRRTNIGHPTKVGEFQGSLETDMLLLQAYYDIDKEIASLTKRIQQIESNPGIQPENKADALAGLRKEIQQRYEDQERLYENTRIAKLERKIDGLVQQLRLEGPALEDEHRRGIIKYIDQLKQELHGLEKIYSAQKVVFPTNETLRTRWAQQTYARQGFREGHVGEMALEAPQRAMQWQLTTQDYLDEQALLFGDLDELRNLRKTLVDRHEREVIAEDSFAVGVVELQDFLKIIDKHDAEIKELEQALRAHEEKMRQLNIPVPTEEELRAYLDALMDAFDDELDMEPPREVTSADLDQIDSLPGDSLEADDAELDNPEQALEDALRDVFAKPQAPADAQPAAPEDAAGPSDSPPALSQPERRNIEFNVSGLQGKLVEFIGITETEAESNPKWEQDQLKAEQGNALMNQIVRVMATGDIANDKKNLDTFINLLKAFDGYINTMDNSPYQRSMIEFKDMAMDMFGYAEIPIPDTIENRIMFGSDAVFAKVSEKLDISPQSGPTNKIDEAICLQAHQQAQALIKECQDAIDRSLSSDNVTGKKGVILNPKIDKASFRGDKRAIIEELQKATEAFDQKAKSDNFSPEDVSQYDQKVKALQQKNSTLDKLTVMKEPPHVKGLLQKGRDMASNVKASIKEKLSAAKSRLS